MTAFANAYSTPIAEQNGILGKVGAAFQRLQENRDRRAIYRRTVRELNDLTNRDLDDLGINRSMISSIAYDAAWGDTK
ncbi:DUF1127 domain-containing protein [Paracoccus sp. TK19116]|uniref:DUF1127 domain-containing protein n=1 Tax=Paracoccus albicereus TaxID=2922394 RepID=A0ABT1MU04_9RHOB|nr:DUF1127 domain-containing protein [Paracoccus albicereus]MCQ0970803.1 DUF1127 domain-containing protein [Paracoccus albicereus]